MKSLDRMIKLANALEKKIKLANSEEYFLAGKKAGIQFIADNNVNLETSPQFRDEDSVKEMVVDQVNRYIEKHDFEESFHKAASGISGLADEEEKKHRIELADMLGSGSSPKDVKQKDLEHRLHGKDPFSSRSRNLREKTILTGLIGLVATIIDHGTNFVLNRNFDSAINSSLDLRLAIKTYLNLGVPRAYQNSVAQTMSEFIPLFLAGFVCGVIFARKKMKDVEITKQVDDYWANFDPSNENVEGSRSYPGFADKSIEDLRRRR